jgi:hypothetical protein
MNAEISDPALEFGMAPMPTCRQAPSSTSAAISRATARSASLGGGLDNSGGGPELPSIT